MAVANLLRPSAAIQWTTGASFRTRTWSATSQLTIASSRERRANRRNSPSRALFKSIANITPRDCLDGGRWHPYLTRDRKPAQSSWVAPNVAIHDKLKAHGDGSIPVLSSESGI